MNYIIELEALLERELEENVRTFIRNFADYKTEGEYETLVKDTLEAIKSKEK